MANRSLIVGLGIGQLYKNVLLELGHRVITIDQDPEKRADFLDINCALAKYNQFDTVHICTPNFTHFDLASQLAPHSKIMFIEKPGVSTSKEWENLVNDNPQTRFMMVKNNMWRNNIPQLQEQASKAKLVNIEWTRRNCIPSPGSWFTTRELAFGGVSRDLMPHLLSLYIALNPEWRTILPNGQASLQNWLLEDIDSTDYGKVNPDGTYDVDDQCNINFGNKWSCKANWRSMTYEKSAIEFTMQDNSIETFELGWCPEDAYYMMIYNALQNINNDQFWKDQLEIDFWIHEKIESL